MDILSSRILLRPSDLDRSHRFYRDVVMIWIQVRDIHAEHAGLAAAAVRIIQEPATEPWGLIEMWIEDPDGIRIVLVEVPADHPIRRDPRSVSPPR